MYEALCSEVTHLHAGLKHQAGLIQKLRPLLNDTKQGKVQTRTPTHTQKTLGKIFFFLKWHKFSMRVERVLIILASRSTVCSMQTSSHVLCCLSAGKTVFCAAQWGDFSYAWSLLCEGVISPKCLKHLDKRQNETVCSSSLVPLQWCVLPQQSSSSLVSSLWVWGEERWKWD